MDETQLASRNKPLAVSTFSYNKNPLMQFHYYIRGSCLWFFYRIASHENCIKMERSKVNFIRISTQREAFPAEVFSFYNADEIQICSVYDLFIKNPIKLQRGFISG